MKLKTKILDNKLVKNSIISGSGIFLVGVVCFLLNMGWPLLFVLFLIPGFIYGLVLNKEKARHSVLFIVGSTFLYSVGFYFIDFANNPTYLSMRIILISIICSSLLFVLYYFCVDQNVPFRGMFPCALLAGLISALPAAGITYYFNNLDNPGGLSSVALLVGTMTIYPLWQASFAGVIALNEIKSSAPFDNLI